MEEGKEEKNIIKTISKVSNNKKINVISRHCSMSPGFLLSHILWKDAALVHFYLHKEVSLGSILLSPPLALIRTVSQHPCFNIFGP